MYIIIIKNVGYVALLSPSDIKDNKYHYIKRLSFHHELKCKVLNEWANILLSSISQNNKILMFCLIFFFFWIISPC